MLKRLLVLAAALAALFVFAPASSAGGGGDPGGGSTLPEECTEFGGDVLDGVDLSNPLEVAQVPGLRECLDELLGSGLNIINIIPLIGGENGEENGDQGDEGDQDEELNNDLVGAEGYGGDALGYEGFGDEGIGDAGGGGGDDGGTVPTGGVRSGFGPTSSDEPGAPLAARGAALLALLGVLGTGLMVMKRRRHSGS